MDRNMRRPGVADDIRQRFLKNAKERRGQILIERWLPQMRVALRI